MKFVVFLGEHTMPIYIYISFMYSTDCNPPKNRKVYKILLNEKVMNRFVSIFLGVPTGEVTTTSHDSI